MNSVFSFLFLYRVFEEIIVIIEIENYVVVGC